MLAAAQPDVVSGVWTCCHNIDPLAEGCVLGPHCDAELQCKRCGGWVPIEKWRSEGRRSSEALSGPSLPLGAPERSLRAVGPRRGRTRSPALAPRRG